MMFRVGVFFAGAALLGAAATIANAVGQSASSASPVPSNPLIDAWKGPFGGVPPWDAVRAEAFPVAFEAALAEERAEVEAIHVFALRVEPISGEAGEQLPLFRAPGR